MPVDDDLDLKTITEKELQDLEDLANKAEAAAKKTDEQKKKVKQNVKEISEDSKKLIGGPAGDINKFSTRKTLPLNAASGENALGYDLSRSPIMGGKTSNIPSDLVEKFEKIADQRIAEKQNQFERDHGEVLTSGNLKDYRKDDFFKENVAEQALQKAQDAEDKVRSFEGKYGQILGALKSGPAGFLSGSVGGLLGKAGLAGMTLLFGEEVTTDLFNLVESWFNTPGGLFDTRKRIKDAVYNIGDLKYQLEIEQGNVFFTDNTNLYQHSPYHSNTENISQYQMRYVYSSKYD